MTDATRSSPDTGLLPCPFCGADAEFVEDWVACEECGASSHASSDPSRLIMFWNRRGAAQSHDVNDLRELAFKMSCHDQYRLATFIAENVGYVLVGEPEIDPPAPTPAIDHVTVEALAEIQGSDGANVGRDGKLLSEHSRTDGENLDDRLPLQKSPGQHEGRSQKGGASGQRADVEHHQDLLKLVDRLEDRLHREDFMGITRGIIEETIEAIRALLASPAPGKPEMPPADFYNNDDYARGYRDGWATAHEPASCGHARANWKDPLFGTPQYRGQEKCEICEAAPSKSEAVADAERLKLADKLENWSPDKGQFLSLIARERRLAAAALRASPASTNAEAVPAYLRNELIELDRLVHDSRVSSEGIGMRLRNTWDTIFSRALGSDSSTQRADACARCGFPRKEHSYNGACYGLCGEFVAASGPQSQTSRADPERAADGNTYRYHATGHPAGGDKK